MRLGGEGRGHGAGLESRLGRCAAVCAPCCAALGIPALSRLLLQPHEVVLCTRCFSQLVCALWGRHCIVSPQRSELKATKASPPAPATGSWPVVHLPAALLHPAQWWRSRASPCCGFCALGQVLSAPFQWVFLGIDLSQIAALVGNELCLAVNFVFLIS